MIVLVIIDGFGVSRDDMKNAVLHAKKPFMDWVVSEGFPMRTIFAHGEYVGLPEGQMGNSEVGHLNIGGGRRIRPDLVIINGLIETGAFFHNPVLLELVRKVADRNGRLHLMGLLSDGGIHSHIRHLEALLKLIADNGSVATFLHGFLDGRDTEPKVADRFVAQTQAMLDSHENQFFRTVGGRSWGMDRDKNWAREEVHYNAIVRGRSDYYAETAEAAVTAAFDRGETDEFVMPSVVDLPDGIDGRVLDGDGAVHFNFRADRAIQMTRALTDEDFSGFDVTGRPRIDMVTFTRYDEYLNVEVAFEGECLHQTLTEIVTSAGLRVFKIAETEKWAHVTKFFNGGCIEPFPGEDRFLVQSPLEVRPFYDKKPEMSAPKIADELEKRIAQRMYDLIVVNFANADMVGHTGNFDATVAAVEAVDRCLKRVYDAVVKAGGTMIVTGDHGNAEQKVDEHGNPETKHTTNPVPFFIMDKSLKLRQDEGALSDIAPTILELMGLPKPEVMTGTSLVLKGKAG
jgi:2,3-bisphosphoglycerate-independent phosphoglycerate mutase